MEKVNKKQQLFQLFDSGKTTDTAIAKIYGASLSGQMLKGVLAET